MADYLNLQTYGLADYFRRAGLFSSGDLSPDVSTVYNNVLCNGFSMLGVMEGIGRPDGVMPCLPYIAETPPYTVDQGGISFPNDDIYWIRTTVEPALDEFSEPDGITEMWTAVSRTLPAGYTDVGRCGLTVIRSDFFQTGIEPDASTTPDNMGWGQPHLIQDFFHTETLGVEGLIQGMQWNHRTPGGYLWNTETTDGLQRTLWSPMVGNDSVVSVPLSGLSLPADATYGYTILPLGLHVGFRGLTLTIHDPTGAGIPRAAGDFSFHLLYIDPNDGDPAAWGDLTQLWEVDAASLPLGASTFTGAFAAPTLGRRMYYYLGARGKITPSEPNSSYRLESATASPRVDVPLPFFVSTKNRVAPGGIVVPP